MKGHLLYFTEELLPLALFSNLEEQQKHIIDEVLSQHLNNTTTSEVNSLKRRGTGLGKPCFLTLTAEVTVDLAKFAGKDSYLFFHILRRSFSAHSCSKLGSGTIVSYC